MQIKMLQSRLDEERDNAEQAQRSIAHLEAKQVRARKFDGARALLRRWQKSFLRRHLHMFDLETLERIKN